MKHQLVFEKCLPYVTFMLVFCMSAPISVAQQQQHSNNSSSLPILSERANGVNSRYLSAASTASLAAATVAAAANAVPQGQNNQNTGSGNQDPNRNFLLHQQQPTIAGNQQQSQQQQTQQQQQQQTVGAQVPQFNNPIQQQVLPTSVMSTTYTFNPITGQFVPTDLATGSQLSNNNFIPQVGGGQSQSSAFGLGAIYGVQPNFPTSQQVNLATHQQRYQNSLYNNPYHQLNLNQFVSQQQQRQQAATNQFLRRAGLQHNIVNSNRLNTINYGGAGFGSQADDDGASGFFQQSNNPVDNGQFGSDSAYSNLPPSYPALGANSQQQQIYEQQQLHPIGLPSTASAATILAPTFNTAFVSSQQQQDYPRGEQCLAADNRHGTCYLASECIRRGGTPMGKCGSSTLDPISSSSSSSSSSSQNSQGGGSSHVCCLFDVTCGQFAAERFVYFRNPNYPNTYEQSRICRAKIGKLDKGVCQLRLDLLRFDVAKPTNGNCSQDMFVVSGQNENYIIPKICGLNDGQHYYVGVDESGVITLHMMMMGFYRRQFELLITQIPCRSDYTAPAHCLQYYMGTHGSIKSFNYDDPQQLVASSSSPLAAYDLLSQQQPQSNDLGGNQVVAPYGLSFNLNPQQLQQRQQLNSRYQQQQQQQQQQYHHQNQQQQLPTYDLYGGYPNDLDYTMCVRKESGFCSITYQLSRTEQGLQPFAVGHSSLYGNDSHHQLGQNWNAVSTECRDDYLLIGGVRLCSGGNQFQSSIVGIDQLNNNGLAPSIQFAQNGSVLSSAGVVGLHHQQLQQRQELLLQQLARLQQQQQAAAGNGSVFASGGGNPNQGANGQAVNGVSQLPVGIGANSNNLEQQQAAIMQQVQQIHQQMQLLLPQSNANRYQQQLQEGQYSDLQGAIITDTTTGPFILRFVSNLARNARGFQIDYRQNPCK